MSSKEQVYKGQSVYNKVTLMLYDFWVLGFSNTFLWKCKTEFLDKHFYQNISKNHADIGVGTGYFLKKHLHLNQKRVALIDLNQQSLNKAKQQIKKHHPEIYKANVLEEFSLNCEKFDSISINYLMHCLPGDIETKSAMFTHIKTLMNPNARLFGSTILGKDIPKNYFTNKLMNLYNKKGIFTNHNDSYEELEKALKKHFSEVHIDLIGCVALFNVKL